MTFALITGSTKGIGKGIADALSQDGYDLLLHYRSNKKNAEEIAASYREKGCTVHLFQADFSDPYAVQKMCREILEKKISLHVIVNNVGQYPIHSLVETPPELWAEVFQVNLHAPVALTNALLSLLRTSEGRVINIGTAGLGGVKAAKTVALYRCTKVALLSWTRSLALESISQKITVNMISPGRMSNSIDKTVKNKEAIPARRTGEISEVSRVVQWLIAAESAYITGQNIEVAGGYLL